MDVVLVRWPHEAQRRRELGDAATPCLLLVEGGAPAPDDIGDLEDWIRVPADERDLDARIRALGRRTRTTPETPPVLDDDGVLRSGTRWVPLPPVEARLTAALLEKFGGVVSRDALARAGWPDGAPGRNALDVHVLRLRRRVAPLALAIRTVRSRGYLLEAAPSGQQTARDA